MPGKRHPIDPLVPLVKAGYGCKRAEDRSPGWGAHRGKTMPPIALDVQRAVRVPVSAKAEEKSVSATLPQLKGGGVGLVVNAKGVIEQITRPDTGVDTGYGKHGLQVGDRIVGVGGKAVTGGSKNARRAMVDAMKAGGRKKPSLQVDVKRTGQTTAAAPVKKVRKGREQREVEFGETANPLAQGGDDEPAATAVQRNNICELVWDITPVDITFEDRGKMGILWVPVRDPETLAEIACIDKLLPVCDLFYPDPSLYDNQCVYMAYLTGRAGCVPRFHWSREARPSSSATRRISTSGERASIPLKIYPCKTCTGRVLRRETAAGVSHGMALGAINGDSTANIPFDDLIDHLSDAPR